MRLGKAGCEIDRDVPQRFGDRIGQQREYNVQVNRLLEVWEIIIVLSKPKRMKDPDERKTSRSQYGQVAELRG